MPFGDELDQAFVAGEPDAATASRARALLEEAVERLIGAGAGVIAMPCNALAAAAAGARSGST